MTMALVQDNTVIEVGLPLNFREYSEDMLAAMGWMKVAGSMPQELPEPGYQWQYGAPWGVEDENVTGTWEQVQTPQPYPSWTFEEGTGWVAPVAKPDGNYDWDEEAGEWVASDLE